MNKADEIREHSSCLNRAADDEPIFVLRAHDELAPGSVLEWADAYLKQKAQQGKISESHLQKYEEAREIARQMVEWKGRNA